MHARFVIRSLWRAPGKRALLVASSAVGSSLLAALLAVSLDIGGRMALELRSYGANLLVTAAAYGPDGTPETLPEDAVRSMKAIFWRHNLLGIAPTLTSRSAVRGVDAEVVGTRFEYEVVIPTGETARLGLRQLRPWWQVSGAWPSEGGREALIGAELARRTGIAAGARTVIALPSGAEVAVRVTGVLLSGDQDDGRVFVPLALLQEALRLSGQVHAFEVSALSKPEDDLARRAAEDQRKLTVAEFDAWYCTAYLSSIAYQIEEAVPRARARVLRRVAASEGAILLRVQGLAWTLCALGLLASALGTSSLLSASIEERRAELGLLKALGSGRLALVPFLLEAAFLGALGGLGGTAAGSVLAREIGLRSFGAPVGFDPVVAPVTMLIAVIVMLGSALPAAGTILRLEPRDLLHGRNG